MKLRLGSLFSGIGGIELGLERTGGFETVFQVEQDEFCRRVLAKHWPDVPRFNDVREVGKHNLPECDVLCGGFPCQDVSGANPRGEGLDGSKSGLWFEYARIIREVRPSYVLVENVPVLTSRGLHRVLADLAACGLDAEWDCIPASFVGAPHKRDRLFLVAYPNSERPAAGAQNRLREATIRDGDRDCARAQAGWQQFEPRAARDRAIQNADREGLEGDERSIVAESRKGRHDTDSAGSGWWESEPDVGRVANGIPSRVDRLKSLGNAVVPQVAEYIGQRILAFHNSIQAAA